MTIFVDTSALIAVADASERHHPEAQSFWADLVSDGVSLLTTNYVLVEAMCLLQRRLGLEALVAFFEDVVPLFRVEWMSAERHQGAVDDLTSLRRRDVGIVDCASFQAMRSLGLSQVFAFDRHFAEQGFQVVP